jgi:PAS domain S-box-containing protein
VTLSVPENRLLFVQDRTAGIQVEVLNQPEALRAGDLVEVTGVSTRGRVHTLIASAQVSRMGEGEFPPAAVCSFAQLMEGDWAGQWVETQGIVHSVRREAGLVFLDVVDGLLHLPVLVQDFPGIDSHQLIDSKIRLRGVLISLTESGSASLKKQIWVSQGKEIRVLEPAPPNPSSLPILTFDPLSHISLDELPPHRIHIQGTILSFLNSRSLLLQDGTGYLQVFAESFGGCAIGDRMDGVGFVTIRDGRVVLENTILGTARAINTGFIHGKGLPLLSSIMDIRSLSAEEASRGYPVKIRGTVTFYDRDTNGAFLQDERTAIYTSVPAHLPELPVGSWVEVEGFTYPGNVSPMVFYPKIRLLGKAPLPKALRTPIDRLTRGDNDCLRIEIQGIVRRVSGLNNTALLEVMSDGKRVLIRIPKFQGKQLPIQLVGAQVTVRGICSSLFNDMGQLSGFGILAPGIEDVSVDPLPWAGNQPPPVKMIKDLPRVNPADPAGRQVRIEGDVLYQLMERGLFLQDASGSIYVQARQATAVSPGTRVSVVGFPNFEDGVLILEDATFQVLGPGLPLRLRKIGAEEAQQGNYQRELVGVEGRLLNQIRTDSGQALVLQSRESVFEALLDGRERPFEGVREGSLIEVTGICVFKRRQESRGNAFQILLRSDQDVRIVRPAPWWTTARLVGAVGFLASILLIASAWGITLRRRVNRQIQLIQTRMEREAALEKEYRDLFENSNDVVFALDLDGKFMSVNRAGEKIFGFTRGELRHIPFWELLAPERQAPVKQNLQKIMAGDIGPPVELELSDRNGRRVSLEINFDSILHEEGPRGVRAIARDTTERKQAELALQAAKENLLQSQKLEAIGTLAGGIAHDFNNILGAILGYAELTLLEASDVEQVNSNQEQIMAAGRRARDLVQQILTFSRKLKHERKPVLLQTVVREAGRLFRATFPSTIEIAIQTDSACKPVLADPTHLHQVIMNLATNSYHAMKASGGQLEILLYPRMVGGAQLGRQPGLPDGEYNCLEIKDNGHGMDKDTLKHLFEPYYTTKPVGSGTGLGLAVVHGIIQEYKGAVLVDSVPGVGTTFWIFLPCCEEEIFEEKDSLDMGPERGKGHILVVDDEKSIVDLTKRILEKMGYTVTTQTDSLEALEIFRARPFAFDLVCTDQTMPQMTGVAFTRELLAIRPDLPVFLCTGYSDEATPEKAYQLGVFKHFYKPVHMKDLAQSIQEALSAVPRGECAG